MLRLAVIAEHFSCEIMADWIGMLFGMAGLLDLSKQEVHEKGQFWDEYVDGNE